MDNYKSYITERGYLLMITVHTDQNPIVYKMMMELPLESDVDLKDITIAYTKNSLGEILGCIAFSSVENNNCFGVFCGFKKKWCSRELIHTAYKLAFQYLKTKRISAIVDLSNKASLKLCLRVGFKAEGTLQGYGTGVGVLLGITEEIFKSHNFKR